MQAQPQESFLRRAATVGFSPEIERVFGLIGASLAAQDSAESGLLDIVVVTRAINKEVESDKEIESLVTKEMIKLATEKGDTDGTGKKINHKMVVASLRAQLWESFQLSNVAAAKEDLKEMRAYLLDALTPRASGGAVTLDVIREILQAPPIVFSNAVADSVVHFLQSKGNTEKVQVTRFLHTFCPGLNEALFTPIRQKMIEKHHTLKVAFNSMAKQNPNKLIVPEMKAGLMALGLDLSEEDIAHVVSAVDYDKSGFVEFDEFVTVFSMGQLAAKKRQGTAFSATPQKEQTQLLEAKLLDAVAKDCAAVLQALKEQDTGSTGSLTPEQLANGLKKVSLDVTVQEAATLMPPPEQDATHVLKYVAFINRYNDALHRSDEKVQSDVAAALKKEHGSMLKAFQYMDSLEGRGSGKLPTSGLKKVLQGMGLLLTDKHVTKLLKLADDKNSGLVNYAGFLNCFSETAAKIGDEDLPNLLKKGQSFKPEDILKWTEELEAEIREVLKGKFDTIQVAFRSFDKDKNGTVDRDEMREGLTKLGLGLTKQQIEAMIHRADRDGNGQINYSEFKTIFETGSVAEAKREEARAHHQKMAEKMAKIEEKDKPLSGVSRRSSTVGIAVSPEAEAFLWKSLQSCCAGMQEAFALLKGREAGKHADLISEKEFLQGCLRLNVRMRLQAGMSQQEVIQLLQHPPVAELPSQQKRELLIKSGWCTEEVARKIIQSLQTQRDQAKRDTRTGEVKLELYEQQAKVIFKYLNQSSSGFLDMGEFVHALSVWKLLHTSPDSNDDAGGSLSFLEPPSQRTTPMRERVETNQKTESARQQHTMQGSPEKATKILPLRKTPEYREYTWAKPGATTGTHLEMTRLSEVEMLKQRLEAAKMAERTLRDRTKLVDERHAQIDRQEKALKEREEKLVQREREIVKAQGALERERVEGEALREVLDRKLAEIEDRAEWIRQQREVLARREVMLKEDAERLQRLQEEALRRSREGGSEKQMLDMNKLSKDYKATAEQRRDETRGGAVKGAKGTGPSGEVRAVRDLLEQEREKYGDKMQEAEALLSGLGLSLGDH